MESLPELRSFLNAEGKLVALPAKKRKKLPALYFLSTKFEPNRDYTESEVNDILDSATAFHDPATLRRELYDHHLLNRTPDCRVYQKETEPLTLSKFISKYIDKEGLIHERTARIG